MSNKGFASLTKAQRAAISKKAGMKSQETARGHAFTKLDAHAAAMRGVQARRNKAAREAAIRLLSAGFTAQQLDAVQLTVAELMYYGGKKATSTHINELKDRVAQLEIEHGSSDNDTKTAPGHGEPNTEEPAE